MTLLMELITRTFIGATNVSRLRRWPTANGYSGPPSFGWREASL